MISWVPEGHSVVMECFGKYTDTKDAGFYLYIPGVYTTKYLPSWGKTANKKGFLIERSEQQINTPNRYCQTKDNVTVKANASIGWKVIDPKKAAYATDHLPGMISDIALNNLRANIGQLSFNEVFASRTELNSKINQELAATVNNWGIELLRVEIQELTYSEETAQAMMKQMVAEHERKAKIAIAEGDSQAVLSKAEANAKALVLNATAKAKATEFKAEAEKLYLLKLSEAVSPQDAAKILEADKRLQATENITMNPAHKVFLPSNTKTVVQTSA